MALSICRYCGNAQVVPGPRNIKILGVCERLPCLIKAYIVLEEVNLLTEKMASDLATWRKEHGPTDGDSNLGGKV